jgi:hypothetical protein
MRALGRRWPSRVWAVEGATGVGRHLAQRLLSDGERVLDVPSKLSTRVRAIDTGHGRLNDPADAHAVAVVGPRTTGLREVRADDQMVALRVLVLFVLLVFVTLGPSYPGVRVASADSVGEALTDAQVLVVACHRGLCSAYWAGRRPLPRPWPFRTPDQRKRPDSLIGQGPNLRRGHLPVMQLQSHGPVHGRCVDPMDDLSDPDTATVV